MNRIGIRLSLFVLAFVTANVAHGVTVRAIATNQASMCCLPNGDAITGVQATHGAIASNPESAE